MTKKTHYFELVILREREEGKKKGGEGQRQRKGQRETQVRMEEKRQEDTERKKQF